MVNWYPDKVLMGEYPNELNICYSLSIYYITENQFVLGLIFCYYFSNQIYTKVCLCTSSDLKICLNLHGGYFSGHQNENCVILLGFAWELPKLHCKFFSCGE